MSLLIVSLDTTILNVALPTIVRALSASSSQLQWIVDAYAVAFAGLLLVLGSLADRFGRKWMFMAALAAFAAGSAGAAFSGTPDRLMAARAFMGVGAAGIMPASLSLLTNVFPEPKERARAIGIWSGTTGLGVALGPMAGGWLLSHFWWGSVFLVNVPIALVGALATGLLVPNSRDPEAKSADPGGTTLSMAGMGLLLWGIIEAPNGGWTSPRVLVALGAAVAGLGAFVVWERRSSHPMLEMSFFRARRFSVAIGATAVVIFALMGGLFLLTQYLQFCLGYSALQTGLRIAPIAAVLLVVAPASTWLSRLGGTKPVVFTGMGLVACGLLLLSRTSVHGTYTDALPPFICLGIGIGLTLAPCTDSVMGTLPRARSGVGSATNGAALQTGGALGVAVLGSLLNGRYQSHLAPAVGQYPVPAPVVHLINGSLGGALAVADRVGGPLGAALADAARHAFVAGMDVAMLAGGLIVGLAALVVLALLPNRPPAESTA